MAEKGWLSNLFEKQDKLDIFIKDGFGIESIDNNDLINAFLIEVGEFLNEVRAFKYWSVKEISQDKAYEEFVDGFHFLLSIGNHFWSLEEMGVIANTLEDRLEKLEKGEINLYTDKYCDYKSKFVGRSVRLFKGSHFLNGTLEDYMDYLVNYMKLGFNVGMSIDMIIEEYNKKHEINYIRQKQGNY